MARAKRDGQPVTQNPKPEPPRGHLPIPRASDVDVTLIDVVSNVRSAESLFGPELKLLGENIADQGQIETVKLVRKGDGRFRLLDGQRRLEWAKSAGVKSVRAEVYDTELTDEQVLRFQLTTFATRQELTHREWAIALGSYLGRTGHKQGDASAALGLKPDFIRKHMAWHKCVGGVQLMIDQGRLSLNKAVLIARLPEAQQLVLAERAHMHAWDEAMLTAKVDDALGRKRPGPLLPPPVANQGERPTSNAQRSTSNQGVQADLDREPSRATVGEEDEEAALKRVENKLAGGGDDSADVGNPARLGRVPASGKRTADARHDQAKRDSDAAAAKALPKIRPTAIRVGISGTVSNGPDGRPVLDGTVTIIRDKQVISLAKGLIYDLPGWEKLLATVAAAGKSAKAK